MGKKGIAWIPADNKRTTTTGRAGGWDAMRGRIKGLEDEEGVRTPMLYAFNTCSDFFRTIPVLQHDPVRMEDLDTNGEDHVADETRYACMSRPWESRFHSSRKKEDRWDRKFAAKEREANSWKTL